MIPTDSHFTCYLRAFIWYIGLDNTTLAYFAIILLSFSFSTTVGTFPVYTGLLIKQGPLPLDLGAVVDEYGFIVYIHVHV